MDLGRKILNRTSRFIGQKARSIYTAGEKAGGRLADYVNTKTTGKTKRDEALTDEEKMLKIMNSESYKPQKERAKKIGSYELTDTGTDNSVYYRDPATKKGYNIARGTSGLRDIATDAMLAGGRFHNSNRWREAVEHNNVVRNRYKGDNVTQSGHSLGGQVSYRLGKRNNERSIGLNPATGYIWNRDARLDKSACSSSNPPEWCSKVHTIRSSTDIVSGLAGGIGTSKVASTEDGGITSHFLDNLYKNKDDITRIGEASN